MDYDLSEPVGFSHTRTGVDLGSRRPSMSAPTDASKTPLPPADPLAPFAATPAELKRLIATERAQVPFVAVRDAAGALALYVLHARGGDVTTIGRRADSGIPLPWDAEVSGLHAEIEEVGGVWTLS